MQEKVFSAAIESIPNVTAWIDEALEKLDCSMKAQMQIDVAIDEIFSNIARYAYPNKSGIVTMQYSFEELSRLFSITFIDQGIPFDPLQQENPDTSLDVQDREIGGLGIFLVRKIMDDISYQYRDGKNILSLKKTI